MATLPLDDEKTYEMMARGDSIGVFQFESEGMREALKKVSPTEFEDLVALDALYRPGAMDQIPTYARGKRNPETDHLHRRPPAPDHRGHQGRDPLPGAGDADRQVARRLHRPEGGRPAQGDRQEEPRRRWPSSSREFFEGCRASGTAEDVIESLWATNEKSADYSFNRSHAACYALIAYRTAWLKANYPAEYMAALISSVMDTKDKVPFFVNQAESMGIEILPPDVNESDHEFMVVDGNIRFGLDAVKGVGYAAVEAIKRAREEGGPFTSLWDFCERVDCRDGQQEGDRGADQVRRVRLHGRDAPRHARRARGRAGAPARRPSRTRRSARARSSTSAASAATAARRSAFAPAHPPIPTHEFERPELLAMEKESIGLFITEHPLKRVREALRMKADCGCAEVIEQQGRRVGEGRRHDHRGQEDPHPHRHAR